ncbi:MAG: hypothetical protein C0599_01055 [Salinivirgaceae bacterium]|nr:MAG: hypothetical protein C0599_01055 [Salinivirgaceae bacterium]
MFYIISKLVGIFLTPLIWIILGVTLSTILFIKKSKHTGKALIATLIITSFLTNPFIANKTFHYWEKKFIKEANSTPNHYDIAVVLSGMVAYGENPRQTNFGQSVDRILEAIRLFHAGKVSQILVTGGNASVHYVQPPEAQILYQFLIEMSIPDTAIIIEAKARNTYENASFTSKLLRKNKLDQKKLLLITSAYHMQRSIACFKKQGLDITPHPVDFYVPFVKTDIGNLLWPSKDALNQWDILWHEWFGIAYYKLMGYI